MSDYILREVSRTCSTVTLLTSDRPLSRAPGLAARIELVEGSPTSSEE